MEPITLNWPGGEDEFLLRLGELEALDDLTESGVMDLRWRLAQGQARGSLAYAPVKVAEIIATLRLGLIGAGMERKAADRKARQAFEAVDVAELALIAYAVISNSLKGKDHDPLAMTEAAEAPTASDGAGSTETA